MDMETLREQTWRANLRLKELGLVLFTWGNVSIRLGDTVAIKPSGVPYESMKPEDMVLVDMQGRVLQGGLRPSSDLPTHLILYRAWPTLGAVVHTHSTHATLFAQARRAIPCLGTTHADTFYGPVPCTRPLTQEEIQGEYEAHTGRVIVEAFGENDPLAVPAALVAQHGPFAWGRSGEEAVEHAAILEECARMALGTLSLNPQALPVDRALLDRHYLRKHGDHAYYGQN